MSGGNSISNFNFLDNVRDSARTPEENRILKPMFGLCLIFAGNINFEDPSLGGRGVRAWKCENASIPANYSGPAITNNNIANSSPGKTSISTLTTRFSGETFRSQIQLTRMWKLWARLEHLNIPCYYRNFEKTRRSILGSDCIDSFFWCSECSLISL